jgi:hypothetical protein
MKLYVRACLVGLALALLVVGGASGTLLRHVVQILPILPALIVLHRRPAWGAYAALAIFSIWLGIVVLIWLFLLGVSRIANGHYTPIEIASTFVMAACSLSGAFAGFLLGRSLSLLRRVVAFVGFGVLQVVAMWVSFLGPIANR